MPDSVVIDDSEFNEIEESVVIEDNDSLEFVESDVESEIESEFSSNEPAFELAESSDVADVDSSLIEDKDERLSSELEAQELDIKTKNN